jgi:hypothetical protein
MRNTASNSSCFRLTSNKNGPHSNNKRFHVDDLSLEQAVTFLALESYSQMKSPSSLMQIDTTSTIPFAPQVRHGQHLLNQLAEIELISSHSSNKAFSLEGKKLWIDHPSAYEWTLSNEYRSHLIDEVMECLSAETLPERWARELPAMIFELALAECLEFFDECTVNRFFLISDADKYPITKMLAELLKKYSVAQSQVLILESAKHASDALATRSCNPYQVAECISKNCWHLIEESEKDKKTLPPLNAKLRPIRSMISQIVYEAVLPGKDGFTLPLSQLTR